MSHTPHELAQDFPAEADRLHKLKTEDTHFARLADEYHDLNRSIHRAEARVEPLSPEYEAELRRKRMALKDQIARMLREA